MCTGCLKMLNLDPRVRGNSKNGRRNQSFAHCRRTLDAGALLYSGFGFGCVSGFGFGCASGCASGCGCDSTYADTDRLCLELLPRNKPQGTAPETAETQNEIAPALR